MTTRCHSTIFTSYCTTLCYSSSVAKQHGNLKNSSHHFCKRYLLALPCLINTSTYSSLLFTFEVVAKQQTNWFLCECNAVSMSIILQLMSSVSFPDQPWSGLGMRPKQIGIQVYSCYLPKFPSSLYSNSWCSSSVAKQQTNKTTASLKSQLCSMFTQLNCHI